ncbi:pickpocket protein 28 isoform X2 [Dendroctonus ponderosae]|uniref:pickpocket protein 28 isoform X2 n=1 Tax=Dendroctonus ponderosae TaxID=77166 RepID=UPI0020360F79|nr:pickpocket protein 28 isoform X2 [Dendroctonus ponderosae]
MAKATSVMKQIRIPLIFIRMRKYFREYCKCSSIHGFRYFGEDRTYFERIWWFVVFNIVVAGCVYSITLVYEKWNDSPVIVSFDTRETKLDSIPFPAVTICPETKSVTSKFNYIDVMLKLKGRKVDANITEIEKRYAEYMSMNCDSNWKFSGRSNTLPADDFLNFLDEVRPKTIFASCIWRKLPRKCEDLFTPIITDEGICYTFNMLDRNDLFKENVVQFKNFMTNPAKKKSSWKVEEGYVDQPVNHHQGIKLDEETYPWRANFAGVKNAFEVTLVTNKDDLNPVCKNGIHGFKVMLHAPMRFPLVGDQYFRVPLDETVLGALQPVKITTSQNVARYKLHQRQCYIDKTDTNPLKYFNIYSQLNCNLDCLTTFTLKTCGCVNFYMPRTNGTKICGSKRAPCMYNAEHYITHVKKKDAVDEKTKTPKGSRCNCMPICSDLSYHIETTQAKWDWPETFKLLYPNNKKFTKYAQSKVIVEETSKEINENTLKPWRTLLKLQRCFF